MLFNGSNDLQIAKALEMSIEEWQETRSACSGPPLELKDQAMPSDPLEPEEVDFKCDYRSKAEEAIGMMSEKEHDMLIAYYKGDTSKPPIRQFKYLCANLKNYNIT